MLSSSSESGGCKIQDGPSAQASVDHAQGQELLHVGICFSGLPHAITRRLNHQPLVSLPKNSTEACFNFSLSASSLCALQIAKDGAELEVESICILAANTLSINFCPSSSRDQMDPFVQKFLPK